MNESKSDHLTSVLLVNNIHCPSCVSYAEDLLRPLSEITKVTISIINHEIRIDHLGAKTAHAAVQELENGAFEIQHVTTINSDGRTINDYDRDGKMPKRSPLLTWPLLLSRAQRKHIENCNACRTKTAGQTKKAKMWAAIRRTDKSFDVEEQDSLGTLVDGASPPIGSNNQDDTANQLVMEKGSNEHTASVSIGGMTCSSCTGSITRELEALDFVTQVNIDLLTNSGTVIYHGPTENIEKIVHAIEDVGYEASVIEIKQKLAKELSKAVSQRYVASLSIEGMTCGSCVGTITEGVQELSFVQEINIDLVGNSGKVSFEGKENVQRILERIDDLGYTATLIELEPQDKAQAEDDAVTERIITIAVEGMYCEHCPNNIMSTLKKAFGDSIVVEEPPTLQVPRMRIRYTPTYPHLTIRKLVNAITDTHEAFSAKIWHPPSIEERSRTMQRHEQWRILARLVFAFLVAIPTLVIGVIYMSLVPSNDSTRMWFEESVWAGNVPRTEWALFIMTTPVMFFGADVFHVRAFKEIKALWGPGSRVPILRRFYRFGSMNLLISAGTSVAYISSVAVLILDARAPPQREMGMGNKSSSYFDSVTFLTFFILIGRFLEAYSKAKAGDAVAMLSKLQPDAAILIETASTEALELENRDSEASQRVQVDLLEVGDHVRVLHGASPPTDGIVSSSGTFLFDESSLTGESKPVKKAAGDQVFAGSVNVSQPVDVKVTSIGGTSMLDKIVAVVREGQTRRAPVERVADTITGYFVPVITLLAIITFVTWLGLGLSGALPERYLNNAQGGWAFWSLEFAIAVFVVACPCGLGLAAPTALFVGGGLAAKNGILVRGGGEAFQEASALDVIVFDKTGTLTEGQMKMTDYEMLQGEEEVEEQSLIFALAKKLEESSTHPIATAIAGYCTEKELEKKSISESEMTEIPGQGMRGRFTVRQEGQEETVYEAAIGNQRLFSSIQEGNKLPENTNVYLDAALSKFQNLGQTTAILYLRHLPANTGSPSPPFQPLIVFAISDPIRPSAHSVLSTLRDRHKLEVHMCTGDTLTTALAIASQLGIPASQVRAGVLPMEKAEYIKELQQQHPSASKKKPSSKASGKPRIVAFVGDGTNDTPALTSASVSIALSSGSDIAISTSSFILLNNDLPTLLTLIELSQRVFSRVKWNFVWAAAYNVMLVPVAAGVLFRVGDVGGSGGNGWRLGPVWASAAMALSSLSVVASSLALRVKPVRKWGYGGRVGGRLIVGWWSSDGLGEW
jgi:P-type Cu+ transporter